MAKIKTKYTLKELKQFEKLIQEKMDDAKNELELNLSTTLGIRANAQLKSPGELERTQFKAQRVIDERDLQKSPDD